MPRILGIDPGSRRTGFGIVDVSNAREVYVSSGIIRLPDNASLPERLKIIYTGVTEIIAEYDPVSMAVEEVFFAKDPRAALKLGQARGAAIVAGMNSGVDVGEYSARTVKQAVVGNGAATKDQVQKMITYLLKLDETPKEDAADALAVALCHAHSARTQANMAGATRYARGRLK